MITSNAHVVAADLQGTGVKAGRRAHELVRYWGQEALREIKREAAEPRTAQRPRGGEEEGPRLLTGSYNRTINMAFRLEGGSPAAFIGTNDVRGRRLELGFVGTDAIGRSFDQASYPHFAPGIAKIAGPFVRSVEAMTAELGR